MNWSPTLDQLRMQLALFSKGMASSRPTEETVVRLLLSLRNQEALVPFRLWLVGSQLDADRRGTDVDVVLSQRGSTPMVDHEIDDGLWTVRAAGIGWRPTAVDIDATFRPHGPSTTCEPLLPDTSLTAIKLLAPRQMMEFLSGGLPAARMVGRFCVEFTRRADATDFYEKLPTRAFDAGVHRFLRPALEIAPGSNVEVILGRMRRRDEGSV